MRPEWETLAVAASLRRGTFPVHAAGSGGFGASALGAAGNFEVGTGRVSTGALAFSAGGGATRRVSPVGFAACDAAAACGVDPFGGAAGAGLGAAAFTAAAAAAAL